MVHLCRCFVTFMKKVCSGSCVSFPFTFPILVDKCQHTRFHGDPLQVLSSAPSPKKSKLPADRESSLSWVRPNGLTTGVSMPIQMGRSSASGGLNRSLSSETLQASSFSSSAFQGQIVSYINCRAIVGARHSKSSAS